MYRYGLPLLAVPNGNQPIHADEVSYAPLKTSNKAAQTG